MVEPRTILIAAPELIPALRERIGASDEDILTFADSEPLAALQAICAAHPPMIALERLFAASPRGAALITRIKADPSLDAIEIRIISHDSDYSRVSPRGPRAAVARTVARAVSRQAAHPRPKPARLDTGTRRAVRFRMRQGVTMMLENRPASVVDLSELGAQVVTHAALKPQQQVRGLLDPGESELDIEGTVVWVRMEQVRGRHGYRAGIEFANPNRPALATFCREHAE